MRPSGAVPSLGRLPLTPRGIGLQGRPTGQGCFALARGSAQPSQLVLQFGQRG